MANATRSVLTKILADASQARREFAELTGSKGTGGVINSMKAVGLAAGLWIGQQAVGALKSMVAAGQEDLESQEQLASVMQDTTGATRGQIAAMEDWVDRTMRATNVADDELRPALANLATFGMDAATAQRTLAIAIDIAMSKGKDLGSVVEALGKFYQGNTGALGRLGIAYKDTEGNVLDFNTVIAAAEAKVGDVAETMAKSAGGRLKGYQLRWEEIKETIGVGLIKAVDAFSSQGAERIRRLLEQQGVALDTARDKFVAMGTAAARIRPTFIQFQSAYEDSTDQLIAMGREMGLTDTQIRLNIESIIEQGDALGYSAGQQKKMTEALETQLPAAEAFADRYDDMNTAARGAAGGVDAFGGALDEAAEKAEEFGPAMMEKLGSLKAAAEAMGDTFSTDVVAEMEEAAQAAANAFYRELLGQMQRSWGVDFGVVERSRSGVRFITQTSGGKTPSAFDEGGVVPGPLGSEQLAVVHGGETILPTHKTGRRGARPSITQINHIQVKGGPDLEYRTLRETQRALDRARRETVG